MNPLAKAIGTVLVLAAGTLGTTLDHGHDLLTAIPGLPVGRTDEGSATNATGNETSDGNSTSGGPGGSGNQTGNETDGAPGNETGNQTDDGGGAPGNGTGNQTDDGNGTVDPEEPEDTSVCDFYVDEWNDDLTPRHHEWEWAVTRDVTSLSVDFEAYGGLPTGLDAHSEARLIDGSGRTLARSSGGDGGIHLALERGTDYLASGSWRLVYDSSDAFSDYSASVHLDCAGQ